MSFTYTLTFDDGVEYFDGVKLSQFAMHQVVDDVAVFTLRLPCCAVYRFIIYARHSALDVSCTDTVCTTINFTRYSVTQVDALSAAGWAWSARGRHTLRWEVGVAGWASSLHGRQS